MNSRVVGLLGAIAFGSIFSAQGAEQLPGTQPLIEEGDLSARMVAGIDQFLTAETERAKKAREGFWKRDFSSPEAYENSVATNRQALAEIIGATESRIPFSELELIATSERDGKVGDAKNYEVHHVRWPVLKGVHGEGLWLRQKSKALATVICLPDADQTPEAIAGLIAGAAPEGQFARAFAEQGFDVFVPVLISREDTFSGNGELRRFTNQPHREWIYRQAYELGLHIIGYEVHKVRALVDWLNRAGDAKVGVAGYGEGGLIALYSAALDTRVKATIVSGYFGPRERLWEEPIYRNVFGLLERFGDAELASLVAPRRLVIEYCEAPKVSGPPPSRQGRGGAAPGKLWTPERYEVEEEVDRARAFFPPKFPTEIEFVHGQEGTLIPPGSPKAVRMVVEKLGGKYVADKSDAPTELTKADATDRQRQQLQELVDYSQHLITRTERQRDAIFWKTNLTLNADKWSDERGAYKERFWSEWIGKFPEPQKQINARSRQIYDEEKWVGYEVMLDVWPGVFAWGILCVPKDLKPEEKRPVVVCQHGLEGVPADTISGPGSQGYGPYKAFTAKLAERGFITFAPHNPYRGQDKFRVLQRKANPLGKSLFSVIIAQHEQILNWLETLPFVDAQRIGFYGLSYGGKTAMRVPSVLDRYCLSICSADFNDWVKKNATVHSNYSYMFMGEYEMPEFALGQMWNYAEMAALIAPRPFMVERGHDDGVAPDEWVAYEFAKVQRFYDKLGIGERTEIEFFNGPHTINGVGTFKFLHRHLNWPEAAAN